MRIVYVLAGLGNGRFTCQGFTDPQNGPDGDRRPSLYSSLPSLTPSDTVSEVTKDSLSRGGVRKFLFHGPFLYVYLCLHQIHCQKSGISVGASLTRSHVFCSSSVYLVCAAFKPSSCFMLSLTLTLLIVLLCSYLYSAF